MASNFKRDSWTVNNNGHSYTAIGYETRGFLNVPIASIENNKCISCTVYEIVQGYKTIAENQYISASKLNDTEIQLLKSVGCTYDGCFITR